MSDIKTEQFFILGYNNDDANNNLEIDTYIDINNCY